MSTRRFARTLPFATAFSIVCLTPACDQTSSSDTTSTDDLTNTEASLTDTQDSLEAAHDTAQACFDAYEACKAASGADLEACRSELTACLPADAPRPPRCAPAPDDDGGVPPPPPPRGDRPKHSDEDRDAEVAAHERACDGGMDEAQGPGHRRHRRGRGHGCERPPVSADELGACRAAADAAIAAGGDVEAAKAAHDQCVAEAFAAHITELCSHAAELCADDNASADACDRVTRACAE